MTNEIKNLRDKFLAAHIKEFAKDIDEDGLVLIYSNLEDFYLAGFDKCYELMQNREWRIVKMIETILWKMTEDRSLDKEWALCELDKILEFANKAGE